MKVFLKTDLGIYCQDGKFRSSVHFGSYKTCCKFWKYPKAAENIAIKNYIKSYEIIYAYNGDIINSNGVITRKG